MLDAKLRRRRKKPALDRVPYRQGQERLPPPCSHAFRDGRRYKTQNCTAPQSAAQSPVARVSRRQLPAGCCSGRPGRTHPLSGRGARQDTAVLEEGACRPARSSRHLRGRWRAAVGVPDGFQLFCLSDDRFGRIRSPRPGRRRFCIKSSRRAVCRVGSPGPHPCPFTPSGNRITPKRKAVFAAGVRAETLKIARLKFRIPLRGMHLREQLCALADALSWPYSSQFYALRHPTKTAIRTGHPLWIPKRTPWCSLSMTTMPV